MTRNAPMAVGVKAVALGAGAAISTGPGDRKERFSRDYSETRRAVRRSTSPEIPEEPKKNDGRRRQCMPPSPVVASPFRLRVLVAFVLYEGPGRGTRQGVVSQEVARRGTDEGAFQLAVVLGCGIGRRLGCRRRLRR